MRYVILSLVNLTLWVNVSGLSLSMVSAQTPSSQSTPAQYVEAAVSHFPTSPKKLSWWQRTKLFFKTVFTQLLGSDDETLITVLGIILAIFLTPFAILVVGLMRKRDDWLLHFILNLLTIVIAWTLYFITCGLGVWITLALLLIAFVHALWYVLSKK